MSFVKGVRIRVTILKHCYLIKSHTTPLACFLPVMCIVECGVGIRSQRIIPNAKIAILPFRLLSAGNEKNAQ